MWARQCTRCGRMDLRQRWATVDLATAAGVFILPWACPECGQPDMELADTATGRAERARRLVDTLNAVGARPHDERGAALDLPNGTLITWDRGRRLWVAPPGPGQRDADDPET